MACLLPHPRCISGWSWIVSEVRCGSDCEVRGGVRPEVSITALSSRLCCSAIKFSSLCGSESRFSGKFTVFLSSASCARGVLINDSCFFKGIVSKHADNFFSNIFVSKTILYGVLYVWILSYDISEEHWAKDFKYIIRRATLRRFSICNKFIIHFNFFQNYFDFINSWISHLETITCSYTTGHLNWYLKFNEIICRYRLLYLSCSSIIN